MNFTKMFAFAALLSTSAAFADSDITINQGEFRMTRCGGTVEATDSAQGDGTGEQINVVFRRVTNCDTVSIGDKTHRLQPQRVGKGASFTIPKKYVKGGINYRQMYVNSNELGPKVEAFDVVWAQSRNDNARPVITPDNPVNDVPPIYVPSSGGSSE